MSGDYIALFDGGADCAAGSFIYKMDVLYNYYYSHLDNESILDIIIYCRNPSTQAEMNSIGISDPNGNMHDATLPGVSPSDTNLYICAIKI